MSDDARAPRRTGGSSGGFPPALKRFGQHFLADRRVLERIADALELTGTETVLEIGPGRGALTELLLARAGRLVAVEIDRALAQLLRERWGSDPRFTLVERDVLQVPLAEVAGEDFVLVGNVPGKLAQHPAERGQRSAEGRNRDDAWQDVRMVGAISGIVELGTEVKLDRRQERPALGKARWGRAQLIEALAAVRRFISIVAVLGVAAHGQAR